MTEPRRVLVWGAGGHGRVVADLIRAAGDRVVGFADAAAHRIREVAEPEGTLVVIAEVQLLALLGDAKPLPAGADTVALGIGANARRLECLAALGVVPSPAYVHPRAVVSRDAALGRASVVLAGVVVNAGASIGAATILNSGSIVEHDCVLGDGVHLSPNATLCGGVKVGQGGWVGAGATVIPGVTIGAGSVVAAGATVTRDVESGDVVGGCPAAPLRRRA